MSTLFRDYSTKQSRMKKFNTEELASAVFVLAVIVGLVFIWILSNGLNY